MIVRLWKGHTTVANAGAYEHHLTQTVFPALRAIGGYAGARLLRRESGDEVEFLVLTEWASWEAIRVFAGEDPGSAVIEPVARALLTRADARVCHYELAAADVGGPNRDATQQHPLPGVG